MKRKVLITAFTPMEGWQQNSSQLLLESLQNDLPEEFASHGISVQFALLPARLSTLADDWWKLRANSFDACILLGQSRGRPAVNLERFAVNILDYRSPDADGETRENTPIDESGPQAFVSTCTCLPELVTTLQSQGVPVKISNHAGASLCNYLYYLALRDDSQDLALEDDSTASPVILFVHLPILPEQAINQWEDSPSLSMALLRRAMIELVIGINAEGNSSR